MKPNYFNPYPFSIPDSERRKMESAIKPAISETAPTKPAKSGISPVLVLLLMVAVAAVFFVIGKGAGRPVEHEKTEDYAIDWKDENLEAAMREITGITDRDIMYSDVKIGRAHV